MAFANKIGNLLKQAVSTKPSLYQAIRCMSSSKLFIGGLSYATDEQSLKEAFTSFGDIVEARVITDRETGRSRGFGFVSFNSAEEASAAISGMDGKDLQGRIVRVNYANERRGGFGGGGGGYTGGGYGGGGYGGGGYNAGGGGGYSGGGYNTGGGGGYGGGGYNTGGGGYNNTGGYGGDGSSGGSYGGDGSSGGGYGGASTGGGYGVASTGGYGGGDYNTGGGGYNNTGGYGGDGSSGGGYGGASTGGYGGASTGGYGGSAGGGNHNMPSSDVHGSTPGKDGFTTGGYAGDLGGAGTVGYQSASNEQYSSSAENTNDHDTYKNQDSSLKGEERFDDEPENYANKQ